MFRCRSRPLFASAGDGGCGIFRAVPPGLVVVSGLPASGKTTLSEKLAAELGFVHVCRDRLHRHLVPLYEHVSPDLRFLGARGLDGIVTDTLVSIFAAGAGAVIDNNFNHIYQAETVRQFVARVRPLCVEICLWGDPGALTERFIERGDPPLTDELRPELEKALARKRQPVLGGHTPTIEFDTTDFAGLDAGLEDLVATVRQLLTGAA